MNLLYKSVDSEFVKSNIVSSKNDVLLYIIKISIFASVIKLNNNMYNGSDIEYLFICYKAEVMPQGDSI